METHQLAENEVLLKALSEKLKVKHQVTGLNSFKSPKDIGPIFAISQEING